MNNIAIALIIKQEAANSKFVLTVEYPTFGLTCLLYHAVIQYGEDFTIIYTITPNKNDNPQSDEIAVNNFAYVSVCTISLL